MQGLFLNKFYEAWNNLKMLSIVILLFGIGVVYLGNDTLLEIFPYVTISTFAVSGIATLRKETASQWNRYELTLPIKRKNLVSSRYLSYIFWTICGLLVSAVVVCITFAIHGNLFAYGLQDCFSLFSLGVGMAVIAGAVFFPLAILFGADKSEILLAISVFSSVCLAVAIINTINILGINYSNYEVKLSIFNLIYIVIYLLSYLLSIALYAKKEF